MNFLLASSFPLHAVFGPESLWGKMEERSNAVNICRVCD